MNQQIIATRANAKHFGAPAVSSSKSSADLKNNVVTKKTKISTTSGTASGNAGGSAPTQTKDDKSQEQALTEKVFRFDDADATEVLLLGDFTDWEKTPVKLIKGGGGTWHTKLQLRPGRHAYRFLVDGQWRNDPDCREAVSNPYGTTNSVIHIV